MNSCSKEAKLLQVYNTIRSKICKLALLDDLVLVGGCFEKHPECLSVPPHLKTCNVGIDSMPTLHVSMIQIKTFYGIES